MQHFKKASLLALLCGNLVTAYAQSAQTKLDELAADTRINFTGHVDAIYNYYGKDYYYCWQSGAAGCSKSFGQWEGELGLQASGLTDLTGDLTLVYQGRSASYLNTAWYNADSSAGSSVDYQRSPALYTELEEAWVGLKHEDYGTVRFGKGYNPYAKAAVGDGSADYGGSEVLETMVGYDSRLFGSKANGVSISSAYYQGAHSKKEIRVYGATETSAYSYKPEGYSVLLDATLKGRYNIKTAMYRDSYSARQWFGNGYGGGSLDASKTSSHGIAVSTAYQADRFSVGLSYNENNRDAADFANSSNANFAVGYHSRIARATFSTWKGPWTLYSFFGQAQYQLSNAQVLTSGSDWLFPGHDFNVIQLGAEVGYALGKKSKAVIGFDWKSYDYQEAPTASGKCDSGSSRVCYDKQAAKVFAGIRSDF